MAEDTREPGIYDATGRKLVAKLEPHPEHPTMGVLIFDVPPVWPLTIVDPPKAAALTNVQGLTIVDDPDEST